jgi:hypothetical protein
VTLTQERCKSSTGCFVRRYAAEHRGNRFAVSVSHGGPLGGEKLWIVMISPIGGGPMPDVHVLNMLYMRLLPWVPMRVVSIVDEYPLPATVVISEDPSVVSMRY